jgi:hypothetical protein
VLFWLNRKLYNSQPTSTSLLDPTTRREKKCQSDAMTFLYMV